MGNRAVITAYTDREVKDSDQIGVYLHWNGGFDSVSAFLKYCELRGFRSPDHDCYGWARLCQIIANFFGGDLSIGIDQCRRLDCDNYDNGVYLIEGWKIVGRKYSRGAEQHEYNLEEMLNEIDSQQPEADRLGEQKIKDLLATKGE